MYLTMIPTPDTPNLNHSPYLRCASSGGLHTVFRIRRRYPQPGFVPKKEGILGVHISSVVTGIVIS
jgi:hypothetical protein